MVSDWLSPVFLLTTSPYVTGGVTTACCSTSAALALDELLSEKAARLIDHPQFGRPGRIIGTRELVAHRNYILVYDVTADTVRVLRVLHAARQWPPQKA